MVPSSRGALVQYEILGELRVVRHGEAVTDLGRPKQRALLALLVLSAGRVVSAERIIDELWAGRPPRTAAHSVQVYVSDLRARLRGPDGDPIETRGGGYVLCAGEDDVDASVFAGLVERGRAALRTGDAVEAADWLNEALALWRGPALSEFAHEEFAQERIAALEMLRVDAVEDLADALLGRGDDTAAVAAATEAVAADPLRERPRELLMRALYRLGRHAEALRSFVRFADTLADELGVDPSPSLRRLYERMLLHDASLLDRSCVEPARSTRSRNPYKGLRPFSPDDADDFFGRDALTARVLDELRLGVPLVTLLGPSGSGKSSVVAAGVLPRLTGPRPVIDVPRDEAGRELLERVPAGSLLVLDQLEELFLHPDPAFVQRFVHALSGALVGGCQALATLRADFYDRPLQHAEIADVFTAGVVTVLPLTAAELELAVTRPAGRVGAALEQGLAAEIVADAVHRPGALPLLQYALTELFEQGMTLAAYRDLGRLGGALQRRAERLVEELTPSELEVAQRLLLRLVRVVPGERDSRRRASMAELTAPHVDPVDLSRVLHLFVQHRLLSIDRDATTSEIVVELAHEALLSEWGRYAGWVERHRAALVDRDALARAAEEWESSGRHGDYLLRGRRLDRFTGLVSDALLTTPRERALLDASLAERAARHAEEAGRRRRGRRRVAIAAAGVAALVVTAATTSLSAGGEDRPRVGLLFHDAGTEVDQRARAGFDRAVTDFDLAGQVHSDEPETAALTLRRLSHEQPDALLVLTVQTDVAPIARDHPDVHYVVVDQEPDLPNVTSIISRDEESSFLAGAAAALTSTTGTIGLIGGVRGELVGRFEAGYVAGAEAVRPDVRVLVEYLSEPPDLHGFGDVAGGEATARRMYGAGADVVFAPAGQAAFGVIEAAADVSEETGQQRWAIGVDQDQHASIVDLPGVVDPERWQRHILTSTTKELDRLVYDALDDLSDGGMRAGRREVGLAEGAVALAYTGGHLDGLRPRLEELRRDIVSGALQVPAAPG